MPHNALLQTEDLLASSTELLAFATAEDWVNFGELMPQYMLRLQALCNVCFSLNDPDAQAQIKPVMLRLQAQHDAVISHTRNRLDQLSYAVTSLQKSRNTARAYSDF
jgi:hypothetical protein